jgi:O-antigen/teichoic acid export membrane protein
MAATGAAKRVMTNAAALAVGGILAQVAFVTLEAVIARQLGPTAYGVFSSVYAYVLIMVHLLDLGTNWQMLQDGSRDRSTLAGNLGTILVIKVCAFLVAYPLMLGALALVDSNGDTMRLFAVFAFFGLAMMIQDVLSTVFSSLQRMAVNAVFQAAVPVAMLLGVLLIVLPSPSLARTGVACVAGTVIVTLVWYVVTIRTVRPRFAVAGWYDVLRRGYHYGISMTLNAFYFRLGVVLLSVLRDHAEVGIFAAAYKLLELGFKIPTLAIRVVAPKLFADSKNDPRKFRWEVDMLIRVTIALSALMAAVLFTVGPSIVVLVFGPAFEASGRLVQVIGVALALKTVALIAQTVLSTADEHIYRARADVITAVAGVVIAVPLIISSGAVGAAIAVATADLVWAGLMLARLHRHLPDSSMLALVAGPVVGLALAVGGVLLMPASVLVETLVVVALLSVILVVTGYLRPVLSFAADLLKHRH